MRIPILTLLTCFFSLICGTGWCQYSQTKEPNSPVPPEVNKYLGTYSPWHIEGADEGTGELVFAISPDGKVVNLRGHFQTQTWEDDPRARARYAAEGEFSGSYPVAAVAKFLQDPGHEKLFVEGKFHAKDNWPNSEPAEGRGSHGSLEMLHNSKDKDQFMVTCNDPECMHLMAGAIFERKKAACGDAPPASSDAESADAGQLTAEKHTYLGRLGEEPIEVTVAMPEKGGSFHGEFVRKKDPSHRYTFDADMESELQGFTAAVKKDGRYVGDLWIDKGLTPENTLWYGRYEPNQHEDDWEGFAFYTAGGGAELHTGINGSEAEKQIKRINQVHAEFGH